ncbi:MAG: DNA polymerase III subunit chi [Candidatus Brocadiia bacterium]
MAESDDKIAAFVRLDSPQDKWAAVAQYVKKCYENGETAAIHVATRDDGEQLDKKIWTFEDRRFIPHFLADEAREPIIEPVLIYCGDEPIGEADVLIEAAGGHALDDIEKFDKIYDLAEVYDDELQELSRKRYRKYQEAGYSMRYKK